MIIIGKLLKTIINGFNIPLTISLKPASIPSPSAIIDETDNTIIKSSIVVPIYRYVFPSASNNPSDLNISIIDGKIIGLFLIKPIKEMSNKMIIIPTTTNIKFLILLFVVIEFIARYCTSELS